MLVPKPISISDAEWQVMHVVWREQPVESQQVIDVLAVANKWSPATVKTMLHRLVKKRVLTFDRDGKRYLYRARVKMGDCVRNEARSFIDRVFSGAAVPALLHLIDNSQLTNDELAELRQRLDRKERNR